jgi:hypothetical protein
MGGQKVRTDQFMKNELEITQFGTKFSKNGPRRSWANPKGKSVKPCFRPQVLWYEGETMIEVVEL